ncbi:hypothetical protein ACIF9R_23040 [Streptomyces sp. NPDC086080]|uniref:hypothetical protein n=1 Tax=Streptomyces sp. NPDC086080 TaxID=3365748 RepID=UPI0037D8943B
MGPDDGGGGNSSYGRVKFTRSKAHFADRITADGRDGRPVEAGRYRLVVSRACPWASRALVSRRLLGLEEGIRYPSEAYDRRETDYPRGVSVPAIVDVPSGKLVTNDYQQIALDLATEWTALHREGAPYLYPRARREEIDATRPVRLDRAHHREELGGRPFGDGSPPAPVRAGEEVPARGRP